jgi:hypothetical protein
MLHCHQHRASGQAYEGSDGSNQHEIHEQEDSRGPLAGQARRRIGCCYYAPREFRFIHGVDMPEGLAMSLAWGAILLNGDRVMLGPFSERCRCRHPAIAHTVRHDPVSCLKFEFVHSSELSQKSATAVRALASALFMAVSDGRVGGRRMVAFQDFAKTATLARALAALTWWILQCRLELAYALRSRAMCCPPRGQPGV